VTRKKDDFSDRVILLILPVGGDQTTVEWRERSSLWMLIDIPQGSTMFLALDQQDQVILIRLMIQLILPLLLFLINLSSIPTPTINLLPFNVSNIE
jgi:hypothetical protein